MSKGFKNDYSYNRYDNYEHVYCRTCGHSLWFKTNHPAICSYCGTMVYPSKKCEFKETMKKLLRKGNKK